jgi:hypothetical protein
VAARHCRRGSIYLRGPRAEIHSAQRRRIRCDPHGLVIPVHVWLCHTLDRDPTLQTEFLAWTRITGHAKS